MLDFGGFQVSDFSKIWAFAQAAMKINFRAPQNKETSNFFRFAAQIRIPDGESVYWSRDAAAQHSKTPSTTLKP